MDKKFVLAFSPHIRDNSSVHRIMIDVVIALLPATFCAVYFFGMPALINIILAVGSAMAAEAIFQLVCKKKVTLGDVSSVVTGLLLALNIPSTVPWYIPVVGSAFAIIICKQLFGGIGHNFINPALGARAMLTISWPVAMTAFVAPFSVDGIAQATPLTLISSGELAALPTEMDMFIGNIGGSMGETSALALIIGGIYLLIRRVISWRIPVIFIGSAAVFLLIFQGVDLLLTNILGGGLMIGAIFMATDYATTPVTPKGQIVFAIGCGFLVSVIRTFGGYPEGVCFSILIMNLATPLIERFTAPKVYGRAKAK